MIHTYSNNITVYFNILKLEDIFKNFEMIIFLKVYISYLLKYKTDVILIILNRSNEKKN